MVKTADNEFYVFGGHISFMGMRSSDIRCNELWKFNIDEESWDLVSTGTPQFQQSALTNLGSTIMKQPTTTSRQASLASLAEGVDKEAEDGTVPCRRSGQCMTYYPPTEKLIIFGGRGSKRADSDMNDLWSFDIKSRTWSKLTGVQGLGHTVERTTLRDVVKMTAIIGKMKPSSPSR